MPTVNRTVRFSAIVDVRGAEELVWDDFPAAELLDEVDALGVHEGRYGLGNNAFLVAQRITEPKGLRALVIYKVTQQDLPMLFNTETGAIRPLEDVLGDDDVDIAEPTFFVFFDGGVVGYVYNHVGARPRHLEMYTGFALNAAIEVRPLPRTDVLEALNSAGEVSLIRFKVPTRLLTPGVASDGILSETRDLVEILPGSEVEVIIRARGAGGRQRLATAAHNVLPRLLGQSVALQKLKVKLGVDDDYRGDAELDLLEEHIVIERQIETVTGRRYLAPDDAVRTVVQAYADLRSSIDHGLEAVV